MKSYLAAARRNAEKRSSGPHVGLLAILLATAALWLIGVTGSAHNVYVDPPAVGDKGAAYTASADPRTLAPATTVMYSLDTLENGAHTTAITGRTLRVNRQASAFLTGWAIDTDGRQPALMVYLQIDRGPLRGFAVDRPRPDVAGHFGSNDLLLCGFRLRLDLRGVPDGPHIALLRITSSDGLAAVIASPLHLQVGSGARTSRV